MRKATDSHFATDHLLPDLKERTVSGSLVTVSAQGVQLMLNFLSVFALARLLSPQDFGLIAMAMTVTGFLRPLSDGGLSSATLQRETITHAQVSNLFWTNVALGGALSAVTALSAPVMSWFYREPYIVPVTLALCGGPLMTGLSVQHLALLRRQMRFGSIAFIQVSSLTAGVVAGIGLAYWGFGYWALVGMQLSTLFFALAATWLLSDWRPQLPTRGVGTRPLLNFGAGLSIGSFAWAIARTGDSLLIGRFFGTEALGLYNRAAALLSRPIEQLMSPIAAVFVPTLSRLQSQPERYRRVLLRVYEAGAMVSFLFTGLLLAVSQPLTLVVLGPKWVEAAPIFAGFTLVALYTPVASIAGWLITSQGRTRDFVAQSLGGSILAVVSYLVGSIWGTVGVAVSYSLFCMFAGLPLIYYFAGREGPVRSKDLWGRFFTHLPLWIVVCGAAWGANHLCPRSSPVSQLLVSGGVGVSAGLLFIAAYPPARRAAMDLVGLFTKDRK